MTGRREREQFLAKIEDVEGELATITASDYVTAQNVQSPIDQQFSERNVGKATFSKDKRRPGRASISAEFDLDMVGGGVLTTVPPADPFLRAAGMRRRRLSYVDTSSRSGDFEHGETVSDGASWSAVVVRDTPEAQTRVHLRDVVGGNPSAVITGQTSGATGDPGSNDALDGGYYYTPDSVVSATFSISGSTWTGGAAPAVGDLLTGTDSDGDQVAAVVLAIDTSGSDTVYEVEPIVSRFEATRTVNAPSGATATCLVAQAQDRTPSISFMHLIDGEQKTGVGARGSLQIVLSSGDPGIFRFRFEGSLESTGDLPLFTGVSNVSADDILRFQSAVCRIEGIRFAIAEMTYDLANETVLRRDGNGANGFRGGAIVDRVPTLSADPARLPDALHSFIGRMQSATTAEIYNAMGDTEGNRILIHVPAGQYTAAADGDRDKEHVKQLEVLLTDPDGAGDNEMAIYFT